MNSFFAGLIRKVSFCTFVLIGVMKLIPRRLVHGRRFPEWTLAFELIQLTGKAFFTYYSGHMKPFLVRLDSLMEKILFVPWNSYCLAHFHMEKTYVCITETLRCEWLRKKSNKQDEQASEKFILFYIQGGGYALMSTNSHMEFICRLMKQTEKYLGDMLHQQNHPASTVDLDAFFVDYRKIPTHQFPAPVEDVIGAYEHLTKTLGISPNRIIVGGDSAGGGLTLSLLLHIKATNIKMMPLTAVLISPLVDLVPVNDEDAPHDFITKTIIDEIRDLYVGPNKTNFTNSIASALYNDLSGLCPLMVQVGDKEVLYPQVLRFAEKVRKSGVPLHLDVHANMPHVFSYFPEMIIPQSKLGVDALAQFVAQFVCNPTFHEKPVFPHATIPPLLAAESA